jgi:UDP-N-acetylenolpyruvoylglucosamine reductase
VRGLVVNLGDLSGIEGGEVPPQAAPGTPADLSALAGTPLSKVINFAVRPGLSGLEWAAGIPGSVGGAVAMNAGAHGHSMGEVVLWVDLMDLAAPRSACRARRSRSRTAARASRAPASSWRQACGCA